MSGYKQALQAIAGMKINEDTNHAELTALCVAIAKIALDSPDPAMEALEIIARGDTFVHDEDLDEMVQVSMDEEEMAGIARAAIA